MELESLEVALLKTNLDKRKSETLKNNPAKARKLEKDSSKKNITLNLDLHDSEEEEDDPHEKEEGSSSEQRLTCLLAKNKRVKIETKHASPEPAEFPSEDDDDSYSKDTEDEEFQVEEVEHEEDCKEDLDGLRDSLEDKEDSEQNYLPRNSLEDVEMVPCS
ncbi:uncharacterized protein LOC131079531 [Cryptomeria japonica]|uniref:uncharacterized protein LOC131079531 n=1 Tax=Cryptomeria japonica TaxID=3369 RepID=UPI0027DA907E|nr:uncharacterized protein LOC131079531 [Cryptomeria japonica]